MTYQDEFIQVARLVQYRKSIMQFTFNKSKRENIVKINAEKALFKNPFIMLKKRSLNKSGT